MDGDRAAPPRLVVVGSISVDRISTPQVHGVRTLGGGGLYAALAAATRTTVGLVGMCSDHPLTAGRPWRSLINDAGLITLSGRGVRFDISYDDAGRATYRTDEAIDERHLCADQLPLGFRGAAGFHLCALGDAATQLRFARRLRSGPQTRRGRLSAGTFLARIAANRSAVLQLLDTCTVFSCSTAEAAALGGVTGLQAALSWLTGVVVSPQRTVVVTDAAAGCHVVTGGTVHHVPAYPSQVVDPTGAGEAFAGAYAACLVEGDGSLDAARYAGAVASMTVEKFGAEALLHADPSVITARVRALDAAVAEVGG